MTSVIIDTDPGTDDALALLMALNSQDLDVRGVTTVGGNARLAHTTRNALRILEHMGRTDIPVSRGATRPLKGKYVYAYHVHGAGGLNVRLPAPRLQPIAERAPEFIIRLASELRGELVVIALGPLTNVANALKAEPWLVDWVRDVVVMGGAVEAPGNVTPYAEFNVYSDPQAAHVVLTSGLPITLVGLDVTTRTFMDRRGAPWFTGDSKSANLANRILGNYFVDHPESDRFHIHDPLAVAAAIQPRLLSFRNARVVVEMEDPEQLGRTEASYGDGQVRVAMKVDAKQARELISRLL